MVKIKQHVLRCRDCTVESEVEYSVESEGKGAGKGAG